MDASDPEMSVGCWRWYSNTFGGDLESDIVVVEVSENGGSSWVNLETIGPGGTEVSGGWYRKELLIAAIPGMSNTNQLRFRFTASDLNAGSVVEAGVDGDGTVGTNDFLMLLPNWGPCP